MSRLFLARAGVLVALVGGLASGCGGSGHRISGKVTFDGTPVPAGKIYFIPDGAKGNSGPTGYADIVDGAYDTSSSGGKAAGTGPMIVAIEGFDPAAKVNDKTAPEGEELVKALFPRFEMTYDVPGSDSEKDFDVSSEAVKEQQKKQKSEGVLITP